MIARICPNLRVLELRYPRIKWADYSMLKPGFGRLQCFPDYAVPHECVVDLLTLFPKLETVNVEYPSADGLRLVWLRLDRQMLEALYSLQLVKQIREQRLSLSHM